MNPAVETFLFGLFGSIAAAMLIGLYKRERQIRAYLKKTKTGLFRALYIKALVAAIRGESVVASSRQIALVMVIAYAAFFFLGSSIVDEQDQNIRNGERALRQSGFLLENDDRAVQTIEGATNRLREAQESLQGQIKRSRKSLEYFKLFVRAVAGVALLALFLWVPYVTMRSLFSYEIGRFSLRIQGLASKVELAKLITAELAVRDTETLREYVMVMKEVGTRHGIPELTQTFELWEP